MDMNTIALIKWLAGNGGGGSSLPTNPAQDGTYALQNTVSSGTSTLSWASGSSGGGVLVVNINEEYTALDKTWQEIHDALAQGIPCVTVFSEDNDVEQGQIVSVSAGAGEYYVYVLSSQATTPFVVHWTATSADGYPVASE